MSRNNKANVTAMKKRMALDNGGLSRLSQHLTQVEKTDPDAANALRQIVRDTFSTPEGLNCLILLENSVLCSAVPNGSSDSALREDNAVRNFVFDIRRIFSNG